MKLLAGEIRRIRANALLEKKFSPDTRLEVTKKDLEDFKKNLLHTLQTKKHAKNLLLLLVETEKVEA